MQVPAVQQLPPRPPHWSHWLSTDWAWASCRPAAQASFRRQAHTVINMTVQERAESISPAVRMLRVPTIPTKKHKRALWAACRIELKEKEKEGFCNERGIEELRASPMRAHCNAACRIARGAAPATLPGNAGRLAGRTVRAPSTVKHCAKCFAAAAGRGAGGVRGEGSSPRATPTLRPGGRPVIIAGARTRMRCAQDLSKPVPIGPPCRR